MFNKAIERDLRKTRFFIPQTHARGLKENQRSEKSSPCFEQVWQTFAQYIENPSEKPEIYHEVKKKTSPQEVDIFDSSQAKTVVSMTAPTNLENRLYDQFHVAYDVKTRSFQ